MDDGQTIAARSCLEGAEQNRITFPEILEQLAGAGFEGYAIDFRRGAATYYLPDGEMIDLPTHRVSVPVAAAFDRAGLQAAIRDAQQQAAGYTYKGFCERAAVAGCSSYFVSISGRRVLYVSRQADTHVEHFPGAH